MLFFHSVAIEDRGRGDWPSRRAKKGKKAERQTEKTVRSWGGGG